MIEMVIQINLSTSEKTTRLVCYKQHHYTYVPKMYTCNKPDRPICMYMYADAQIASIELLIFIFMIINSYNIKKFITTK